MIKQILDLHIHSKYSRACSKHLELPEIARVCEIRGIDIVATGDFTHPAWFAHMKECLVEDTPGMYKLKSGESKTKFIIGTEVASIKKHKEKTRRVHLCLYAPTLEVAEQFNKRLADGGFNLKSDGRPILGMTSKDILQVMLNVDPRMVMIPAHAWTPWFGIFGSKGGYDSLEEAFDELAPHIFAIETGLSSDPLMNWQWSHLNNITLISNSDAHSPAKLGREANVMQFENDADVTYDEIMRILREEDKEKFLHTIEFYPEEGKYHADGHRDCQFFCSPKESKRLDNTCPRCNKPLIIGVENRVHELADRTKKEGEEYAQKEKVPFKNIIPLTEILANVFDCGVGTKKVSCAYDELTQALGTEFHILLDAPLTDIKKVSGKDIARAIKRMREGNVYIRPGYDGEFGVVTVCKGKKD
ncbi:endonuclease Q family protein [Patescibacteria group bacterium]|nr:endonuclease Q family protein [Patescibacteria group bacterium]MBU1722199.1 endonuclease Q family protein [Patescibacteria group bacterium]MBU1901150.1 endonuclease Q family protein [Patescibacteria group bacterium]